MTETEVFHELLTNPVITVPILFGVALGIIIGILVYDKARETHPYLWKNHFLFIPRGGVIVIALSFLAMMLSLSALIPLQIIFHKALLAYSSAFLGWYTLMLTIYVTVVLKSSCDRTAFVEMFLEEKKARFMKHPAQ